MAKCFALILLLTLLLAGCSQFSRATPTALPTVVLDSGKPAAASAATVTPPTGSSNAEAGPKTSGGPVTPATSATRDSAVTNSNSVANGSSVASGSSVATASGKIVPAQTIQLASTAGGRILSLSVDVGDVVKAGQVLVKLSGSEKLSAAVTAANFELLNAQQALKDLNDNAEAAHAQAQQRLAKAKDAYDQAQKHRGWKEYRVGGDNQIAVARADLIVAEDQVKKVEEVYGGYADNPEDDLNKAAALSAVSAARIARDKAKANLNYLLSLPNSIEVEKADADLEAARVEQEVAQRQFDRFKNGPDPDLLALAQERVKNAQAQLAASQSALADLELKAPFDGTISQVSLRAGEWAAPGQAVLALADLGHLRVETTDLSEVNIPQVQTGQPVKVLVKALNQEVIGQVKSIAPLAQTLGGDVVYTTTIELANPPRTLRAGMSVEVTFLAWQQ